MAVNHQTILDYFSNIAETLNDLNGFFRMDLTEIQGSFRSNTKFPCMVLESHEGDFGDSNVMQSVNNRTIAFTIYTKPEHQNYTDQNTKLATAEEIGLKILARMRHDAATPGNILYNNFKIETITYAKVGPVFNEQLYGYRFIGSIKTHKALTINPNDWSDNPTTC